MAASQSGMISKGKKLPPGAHKVGIGFTVLGLGDISFEIADQVV